MLLAAENDLQAHARLLVLPHLTVDQDELNTAQQLSGLIRLDDEIISAALQTANDIMRIRQGGYQHHRDFGQPGVPFDAPAQLVAVHFGHDHITDDERRSGSLRCFQGHAPVCRGGHGVAVLFQDVLQPLGLSCTVLGNQDFHR